MEWPSLICSWANTTHRLVCSIYLWGSVYKVNLLCLFSVNISIYQSVCMSVCLSVYCSLYIIFCLFIILSVLSFFLLFFVSSFVLSTNYSNYL